jgi:hypothetical protein
MKKDYLIIIGVGVLGYILWKKTQVNRSLGGRVIEEGTSNASGLNNTRRTATQYGSGHRFG